MAGKKDDSGSTTGRWWLGSGGAGIAADKLTENKKRKRCLMDGGTWDAKTKTCKK